MRRIAANDSPCSRHRPGTRSSLTPCLRPLLAATMIQLILAGCGGSGGADPEPVAADDRGPNVDGDSTAGGSTSSPDADDSGADGDPGGPILNSAPIADAGIDQSVQEGTLVTLTASASDAEGDTLSFAWTQIAGPEADLTGADSATATFTAADVESEARLTFRLTVVDNQGASATDEIDVRILDNEPTAYAGNDQAVSEATEVVLDALGSASWGTIQAYFWEQVAGPVVALDDAAAPRPRFIAPDTAAETVLEFRLTVVEDDGDSDTDTVAVRVFPSQAIPNDANRFLTFLNASRLPYAGSEQTAAAYYDAIDPTGQKTTLGAWIAANAFDVATDQRAVYRNAADLGFGRIMSLHTSAEGYVAAYVENYPTLASAVNAFETGSRTELLATVAMEWSPGPSGGEPYTKFYTFGPDDSRITSIDLDGRGAKFVPGLCNVCHGGEPKPLVSGAFPDQGHTDAQFLPWDLDTYEFSNDPDYTRDAQEPTLKALNAGALRTYPTIPTAGAWSGRVARELIEGWYGGAGLPASSFNGEFVPLGWRTPENGGPAGNPSDSEEIYLDVIGPNCRACHVVRGRYLDSYAEGESIDFATYEDFIDYQEQTIDLVFDASEMPDALVTFGNFWSTREDGVIAAEKLARHLGVNPLEQRPGRPIADPGPNRSTPIGPVALNAAASHFADSFAWQFASGGRPAGSGATLNGASSASPTFVADQPGAYRIELVVGQGAATSAAELLSIVATFGVETQSFATDIAPILMGQCASCHSLNGSQSVAGIPARFDDPVTLYETVRRYVDLNDVVQSPILTKPSGRQHGGGKVQGFDLNETAPSAARTLSNRMIQWIAEGAADN